MDKQLTQEQRDEIAQLSNNGLPDSVYLEWLDNYGDFSDFDEAYAGEFRSDKEFAQDMAENIGGLPEAGSSQWPLYCIDWEYAASELMMDYTETQGHYFRAI